MKLGGMWQAAAMVGILSLSSCSKHTTAPKVPEPPAVVSSEFEYSLGSFYADSGYTVKSLEYADANGVVRTVDYRDPLWRQTLVLKPGDRIYVRAEVAFQSILAGRIQVVGPAPFYAASIAERVDGPATVVLMVDQVLK
jgi:hypothetical protein